jgi:hypothetical protein
VAGHIATSKRTDWCTPAEVLDIARTAFGGEIGLDPCSNAQSIVNARREIRFGRPGDIAARTDDGRLIVHGDGLEAAWGRGSAFVNPPFGTIHVHRETLRIVEADEWKQIPSEERSAYDTKSIGMWTAKCRAEHEAYAAEVCLLIPASVDTTHWHRDVWPVASAVGFFKGRLQFLGAHESKGWCAPMACALAYFGHRPQRFEAAFRPSGKVVRP